MKSSVRTIKKNIDNNNNQPQQQHKIINQQVFECLINTATLNTTTYQYQAHDTIQKSKIWNVIISSFIKAQHTLANWELIKHNLH